MPEDHVIRFFFDMSDLLSAGLPVDRALALISTNQTHKGFQRIVNDILEEVQGGSDLSSALGKYTDVFGNVSDHMVRAGEASGTLSPILRRLAQYIEQRRAFRQSLISSMIYPAILLATSLVSMVVLLVYVIPKFAEIFRDLNQEVPFLTNLMLQTGIFLREYGWVFPVLLLLIIWGGRRLYRRPHVRRVVDRALVRTPFTRKLVLFSELTRFCRTLGTMLQSGVPLLKALSLGQEVLMNTLLKEKIAPLHREIKVGHSMSNFFRANEPFPPRIGTMLRISEEQGNLGEGLLALGDFFERELQRTIQKLMTLMEPVVILSTGLIIGVMVLSMFSAIFGINEIRF